MAGKRFTAEQIIIKLREAEVGLAQGQTVGQQAVVHISSVPQSLHHHFAGRILVEAPHPDLADAVTVHPVCQEELDNPGRDRSTVRRERAVVSHERQWGKHPCTATF